MKIKSYQCKKDLAGRATTLIGFFELYLFCWVILGFQTCFAGRVSLDESIQALRDQDFSEDQIQRVKGKSDFIVSSSKLKIGRVCPWLRSRGFKKVEEMIVAAPSILSFSVEKNLDPTCDALPPYGGFR